MVRGLIDSGEPYTLKMLAINGGDLIRAGVAPGPMLGELLNRALDGVIEGDVRNERATLLSFLQLS